MNTSEHEFFLFIWMKECTFMNFSSTTQQIERKRNNTIVESHWGEWFVCCCYSNCYMWSTHCWFGWLVHLFVHFFHIIDTNLNTQPLCCGLLPQIFVFIHTLPFFLFLVILTIKFYWFRWRGLPWGIHIRINGCEKKHTHEGWKFSSLRLFFDVAKQ